MSTDWLIPLQLLKSRADFWEDLRAGRPLGPALAGMLFFIVAASAAYGTVLGGWNSPRLALYVALKLPILLLGTTALVMLLNWMTATARGSGLSLGQVAAITFGAMTIACWLLLSLIPVTLFVSWSLPLPAAGPASGSRYAHNCLLLTHILLIAVAGLAGNAALRGGLAQLVRPAAHPGRIYRDWLLAFTLVGCQLSWILRPFVGSPFYDVAFLRADALQRNFFEFVLFEILPYVIQGGN